jgi:hypothetical protein
MSRPIYVRVKDKWLVAGATSRGSDDSERVCGDAGIYARLDKHLEWISQVAKEKGKVDLPQP